LDSTLSELQKRYLATIFDRGAASASDALSRWLGRPVRLVVSEVDQLGLEEASEILGPGDELVAACVMELTKALTGQLILLFEDRSGLALVDMLLGQPVGSTVAWGELEQSAAKETTNIVGCAYLNALAAHLPALSSSARSDRDALVPGPPHFRHEFVASLLEFALMDQAVRGDQLLLIKSCFSIDDAKLDWSLLFVPSGESLETLCAVLARVESSRS
jgi:chemotaxis protein CheC